MLDYLQKEMQRNLSAVYGYGGLMLVMAFASLVFGATAGKFAASASTGLAANLREAIYDNIQTFSFPTSTSSASRDWSPG